MVAPKDLTGLSFGRLVALRRTGSDKRGRAIWLFRCECGSEVERSTANILRRSDCSCGCVKSGWKNKGRTPASKTHGRTRTRLYRVWQNMRDRCRNSSNYRFRDYGGRGIRVCKDWQKFEVFATWADQNGYSDDLQIDRIDNEAGYSPNNCRFVTPAENMRNQRTTIRYIVHGIERTLPELAESSGLRKSTIQHRIEQIGMSPEAAIAVDRLTPGARPKHGRYSKPAMPKP